MQEEIERFFEQGESPALPEGAFLTEAKRALPAELYEQVRRIYRAYEGSSPALVSAGQ